MKRIGFKVVEVTTPGRLDWDIVEGMIRNESVDLGRLWHHFAYSANDNCKAQLQDWISVNSLSSHMRILAQK